MSGKLRVLISALLLSPMAAMALGLGEIRLNSALNEPLSAEIDLVAATPEELGSLEANLASGEVFARYGLDRQAFLNSLEFNVGRGQDGRSVLLVRSRDRSASRSSPSWSMSAGHAAGCCANTPSCWIRRRCSLPRRARLRRQSLLR